MVIVPGERLVVLLRGRMQTALCDKGRAPQPRRRKRGNHGATHSTTVAGRADRSGDISARPGDELGGTRAWWWRRYPLRRRRSHGRRLLRWTHGWRPLRRREFWREPFFSPITFVQHAVPQFSRTDAAFFGTNAFVPGATFGAVHTVSLTGTAERSAASGHTFPSAVPAGTHCDAQYVVASYA